MKHRLRHSVRAIIFDEAGKVLLCRFNLSLQGIELWTTPGGGVEAGESAYDALRRELDEEIGLSLHAQPPHVWHQTVVAQGHADGYDGVVNDVYLVKTRNFEPRGSLGANALRRENIDGFRWWTSEDLLDYEGDALFGPRELPRLLAHLQTHGVPKVPIALGP